MKNFIFDKKKGLVLVVCTAILLVLSTLALTFLRLSVFERKIANIYIDQVQAKLIAYSGVDYAIASLRSNMKSFCSAGSESDLDYGRWIYRSFTGEMGAGTDISQSLKDLNKTIPSFPLRKNGILQERAGYYISGLIKTLENSYTLKILDTSSQLDINYVDQETWKRMFGVLLLEVFGSEKGQNGDWKNVVNNILAKRNLQKNRVFLSKKDIVGNGLLTESEFAIIKDYITVHCWRSNHTWKKLNTYNPSLPNSTEQINIDKSDFDMEQRAPININTATKQVLTSVLFGLSGHFRTTNPDASVVLGHQKNEIIKNTITLNIEKTRKIVDEIIAKRKKTPFKNWNNFYSFIDSLTLLNPEEKALIKANVNPNAMINRWLPNQERYQIIDKSDLISRSTEFCFTPSGYFEIVCVGRITQKNRVIAEVKAETIVQISEMIEHSSQRDFASGEFNNSVSFPETNFHIKNSNFRDKEGLHISQNGSPFDGYIQSIKQVEFTANRLSKLAFPVNNDFESLWHTTIASKQIAPAVNNKMPATTADVRSVFKGESRLPEGVISFHYGGFDQTNNGEIVSYNLDDIVADSSLFAKEGSISLWIKFDNIAQGSDEAILYLNQQLEQASGKTKGINLKVFRYGDEILISRSLWENPVNIIFAFAPLLIKNDIPEFLWTRIKLRGLSNKRKSRKWYRLLIGWRDYTKVYTMFTSDNGSFQQQDFTESLTNTSPNDGQTGTIRMEWISGSNTTANGKNLGENYLSLGGHAFTASKSGHIYLQKEPDFVLGSKYHHFSNTMFANVEFYNKCLAENISDYTNFMETPYLDCNFKNKIIVNCGCNEFPCPEKNKVDVLCANNTMWNAENAICVKLQNREIDTDLGFFTQNTDAILCGTDLEYEVELNNPDNGETTAIFDDLTIFCCRDYPKFFTWCFE